MKLIIIFAIVFILLLLLFLYSALVISSRCSRIEEKYLNEEDYIE